MVRMIVREENPVDMPDAEAKLRKPNHSATATVDENAFLTGLNSVDVPNALICALGIPVPRSVTRRTSSAGGSHVMITL